jgi:hypothetical protein
MQRRSLVALACSLALSALAVAGDDAPPAPDQPFTEDADGDGVAERGRVVTEDYTLEWVPLEEWGIDAGANAESASERVSLEIAYSSMESGFTIPYTLVGSLQDDFEIEGARGQLVLVHEFRFGGGVSVPGTKIKFRWIDPQFGPGAAIPVTFPMAGNFGYRIPLATPFQFRDNGYFRLESATDQENGGLGPTEFSWFTSAGQETVGENQGSPGTGDGTPEGTIWTFEFTIEQRCLGDQNFDRVVDGADLGLLLGDWGTSLSQRDINQDGVVDGADLGLLLGEWGPCP